MLPFNGIATISVTSSPSFSKKNWNVLRISKQELKFKSDAKRVFCKALVPFALRDDLVKAYEEGIASGVW